MKQEPLPKKKLPFIEGFISQTLSQNLTAISGAPVQAELSTLSFDDFKHEAEKMETGRFLNVYTETDRAVMTVLLPEAARNTFKKKTNDMEQTELLNRLVGNLPYICSVKENGTEKNIITLQKPYSSGLKDQLLWDFSECKIFRCSAFGAVFYLPFNIELQKQIERLLKFDPVFKKTLRERIVGNKVSGESLCVLYDSDIKVRVKNPLEFIIGGSFLPRETRIGKKDVSVVFNGIISAEQPISRINEQMIWYRFSVISNGVDYPVYYSAEVKNRDKKYIQFFNSLFTEMLKKTAVLLRTQSGFERVSGKIVSPPSGENLSDALILSADINWENKRINTRIFVPGLFFSGYLSSFLETWEVETLQNRKISYLLYLLSINSTIFGENINTFYWPPISVSKILAILDTNNASRLVQNYFLAGGSSLEEFQALFLYKYSVEGEEKAKIGRDALFNKEDYKKYIPKALHADWDICSGTSSCYEELAVLNEKALKGIYQAMQEDKLLMPYKVSFILYNEFQKPLDERFKSEIKKLIEETRWQDLFEDIPKKTGQQAVSAIPTQSLGKALVAGRPTVSELAHLISKTKRTELDEELRLNTKKYELGSLSAEKVFLALKDFLDILNQLASPDEEMI